MRHSFSPNQRFYFLRARIRNFFVTRTALRNLILANMLVSVSLWIVQGATNLFSYLLQRPLAATWIDKFLAFSANTTTAIYHPWTIVTNLFVHANFWHLFFNMFMLYVAGKIFLQYLSQKQLVTTYFFGGILGNLCFMAAYNFFPVFAAVAAESICVGASGAVMAILLAATVYRPNHPLQLVLIGQITLKWLAVIFIGIDLLSLTGNNAGGHFAHLGGALYGAIAAALFRYGVHFRKIVFLKNHKKYASSARNYQRPMSDSDYNAQKHQNEAKVDAILDKISKSGYGSLSKEERDFLFYYKR